MSKYFKFGGLLVALGIVLYVLIHKLNPERVQKIQNYFDLYREVEIGGFVLKRSNNWILQRVKNENSRVYFIYGLVPVLPEPSERREQDKIFNDTSKFVSFVDVKTGNKLNIFDVSKFKAPILRDATQSQQVRDSVYFLDNGKSDSVPACMKTYQGFYSFDINEKFKEKRNLNAIFYIDDYRVAGHVTNPGNLCEFISERNIKQIDAHDFDITS